MKSHLLHSEPLGFAETESLSSVVGRMVDHAISRVYRFRDRIRGSANGIVWIVGAGPGDPELLTIEGLHVLQSADVVAHDEPRLRTH